MIRYRGRFMDGLSAAPVEVDIEMGDEALVISTPGGDVHEAWAYKDLRPLEDVYPGQPVRLRSRRSGDARLTVDSPDFIDALKARSRRFRRYDRRGHNSLRRSLAWGAATIGVFAGLYFVIPLAAEPVASVIPLSWEKRIGETAREQFLSILNIGGATRYCTNPRGEEALQRLTRRLSAQIESRYDFRVQVVDHPLVNAVALPGGYILVFRGLIDQAESPEEVAGVLAHEMGHVVERHGTESIVRSVGWSLVMAAVVGDTSGIGSIARDFGNDMMQRSYSRDLEREADEIGIRILNRADIRGMGFVSFFGRMSERQGDTEGGLRSYMSTHPPSGERAETARRLAQGSGPAMPPSDWRDLRTICEEATKL